jgi:hypothetical protein
MSALHPNQGSTGLNRREFMKRAAAAGIALPSLSAILAACGSGAQTNVGGNQSTGGDTS